MDIFNQPPSISEDTLIYAIYPAAYTDKASVTALAVVMGDFAHSLLPGHLWHRDSFELKVNENEEKEGWILEGRMRVGDCVDDEWCAVWLLYQISSKWDVAISASDSDGQFLLIEAAEYLPSWVTPSNAENRVWIHNAHIHLIDLDHVSSPFTKPHRRRPGTRDSDDEDDLAQEDADVDYLSVQDALKALRDPLTDTQASKDIENSVTRKIHGYPSAATQHVHYTKAQIPVDIAKAVFSDPALVQKAVETFYTRDALQLRAAHKMARFPPEPAVMTTVKMTRVAYAQLIGQKFYPPRIFGRWQEKEGTPEWRVKDVGMKLACGFEMLYQESKRKATSLDTFIDGSQAAQAKKDALWQNPDYVTYLRLLKDAGYFKGELEGSARFKQLEEQAMSAFVNTRRDDDSNRPSFAFGVDAAISRAGKEFISNRAADSDDWLNVDLDAVFGEATSQGPSSQQTNAGATLPTENDELDEDQEEKEQVSELRNLAKQVEEFVEGEGDLEGARFFDEEFSEGSDGGLDDSSSSEDDVKMEDSDPQETERQAAMEKLVPPIDPSEYGKMPARFFSNSQRVARSTVETDVVDDPDERESPTFTPTKNRDRPLRPPIIPRDEYDGVDSDDESDADAQDDESDDEKPLLVGDVDIDMEEEQEEFLEFARQALGVSDQQWDEIVKERADRGAYVPKEKGGASQGRSANKPHHQPQDQATVKRGDEQGTGRDLPKANESLSSFEAVMEAMDAELERVHRAKESAHTTAEDKGKGKQKADDVDVRECGDIESAIDAELNAALNGEDSDAEEGSVVEGQDDYQLMRNFLESFKSQNGLPGPVGNLFGRLQPGWTLPRDES